MRSALAVCILAAALGTPGASASEQAVMRLESEDPAQWGPAVEALLAQRDSRVPREALSSVLKRLDALEPSQRTRVAALATIEAEQALSAAGKATVVAFMAATLLLAVATFLWGFRLLQVRRLLRHLSVSKARSVAPGLVSLQGEVHPVQNEMLVHPDTEEACVYYDGADTATPGHRFWLVDDSGRVLVEPRGALLLSEDGTLVPGERVHLIATAHRLGRAGNDAKAPTILRAGSTPASAFARIGRRLLQSVMDARTTRLLFSDPRQMLLIWDDAHGAPFSSPRETALMFLSFAIAASWILLFLAAVLVLADDRFAATLRSLTG